MIIISMMIMMILSSILMFLSSVISKKSSKDREKSSPFECGFDPYKTARSPFSLRFFLIAMIFLIFDVEITLLIPIPMILKQNFDLPSLILITIFLILLLIGLIYEWKTGALNWA
uniref:NADH-ubiquinone oxidoreductase chain 3 n=1 Tax=Scolopocryptops sp. 1 YG-2013 TaxID=1285684 RepID=R4IV90_9MYRI|nr:NAHD dehydrogenase subunit 3 [Scolopocryptops sp. 1 YG-2013]